MQFWHAAISRVFNISIFSGLTTTPGAASTALPLGSVVKPPSSLASSTASPLPTTPDSAVSQSSNSVQQLPPALANGLLMNRGIVQPDVQQVRNLVLIIMFPKLILRTVRKNCLSDEEELMKFEAEGREFAKFEITRTVKKSE